MLNGILNISNLIIWHSLHVLTALFKDVVYDNFLTESPESHDFLETILLCPLISVLFCSDVGIYLHFKLTSVASEYVSLFLT